MAIVRNYEHTLLKSQRAREMRDLVKGKKLAIGTIREHGGVKKKKTSKGWVLVGAVKKIKETTPSKKVPTKSIPLTPKRKKRDEDDFAKELEKQKKKLDE